MVRGGGEVNERTERGDLGQIGVGEHLVKYIRKGSSNSIEWTEWLSRTFGSPSASPLTEATFW